MMKYLLFFFISLIIIGCVHNDNGDTNKQRTSSTGSEDYLLVWNDEFSYTGLPDSTKWKYATEGNEDGWGNDEAQHYTVLKKDNAWVDKGVLQIIAQKEEYAGRQYTSARLVSKADWQYGRIEVRAKLPSALGTWSAIWMMPGGWSFNDGNWPDVGEIDIMEHVGHEPGVVHASAHSKDYQWKKNTQKTATVFIPEATKEFHTYVLEWTADHLKAFVNDSLYFEYQNEGLGESKWPYDKPFHLIMNIAVGGVWGDDKGIDDDAFPQSMEVDYVRIYQLIE